VTAFGQWSPGCTCIGICICTCRIPVDSVVYGKSSRVRTLAFRENVSEAAVGAIPL